MRTDNAAADAHEAMMIEEAAQQREAELNAKADDIFSDTSKVGEVLLSITDTWDDNDKGNDLDVFESLLHKVITSDDIMTVAKAISDMRTMYDKHCYEIAEGESDD